MKKTRLTDRWKLAADRLQACERLEWDERVRLARALRDVATCLYANGRVVALAWLERQLPYELEFNPSVGRMLSHIKDHLLRKSRENGD